MNLESALKKFEVKLDAFTERTLQKARVIRTLGVWALELPPDEVDILLLVAEHKNG